MGSFAVSSGQDARDTGAETPKQLQERRDVPQLHSSEYDEDDELTPLAYARRYGLTANYLDEAPFLTINAVHSPNTLYADLEDPESSLHITDLFNLVGLDGITLTEKWNVDKETASFLASVIALGKGDKPSYLRQVCSTAYLSDLKLEESLLSSDPEMDVWRLKQRNGIAISSDGMEPLELEDEIGESFAWSTSDLRARPEIERLVTNEKLDVDPEMMQYLLKDVMSLGSTAHEDSMCAERGQSNIGIPSPVSPPLLSMSPPLSLGEPDSAALAMEFTSTPDDLTAKEATLAENRLLKRDDVLSPKSFPSLRDNANLDPRSLYSPLASPKDSSSSPLRNKQIKHLEADVPLIPQDFPELPQNELQTVSFPEKLHTVIPSADIEGFTSDLEQDIDSCTKFVTTFAEKARHLVANEQLVEFDTTMRVAVPTVENIKPLLPWQSSTDKAPTLALYKEFLERASNDVARREARWSGVSQVERVLSWTPFPAYLGQVQFDETFDDSPLARCLAEISLKDHIDVDSLIWKPEAPRILDAAESDDEELEAVDIEEEDEPSQTHTTKTHAFEDPPRQPEDAMFAAKSGIKRTEPCRLDMLTLLRKRKLELDDGNDSKRQTKQLNQSNADARNGDETNTNNMIIDAVDHVGGLSNFMHLHGSQAKSPNMPKKPHVPLLQELAPPAVMLDPEVKQKESTTYSLPLSAPEIKGAEKQRSVVLSSNYGANRALIRQVLNILPSIDLVERDPIVLPGKTDQPALKHGSKYDADITVSASTGLIFTTLQKIKQKPLPGQSTFFGIRDRVRDVTVRYERLIVLVNEAKQSPDRDPSFARFLDATDTEALSDLIALGAALRTEIEVYYIAGGEQELANWIAALISRHSVPDGGTKLLHDETLWERFLRHAGLNAFAAQAILSELKRSEDRVLEESSSTMKNFGAPSHGLAAFVEMTIEQRIERLGALMGGDRVLRSVSDVVDSYWRSASTMEH